MIFLVLILLLLLKNISSFPYISKSRIKRIINQDALNTSQYDCIVMYEFDRGYCTGTFINNHTLITAAHCLDEDDRVYYINDQDVSNVKQRTIIHNNYLEDRRDYDIALVTFYDYTYNCSRYFDVANSTTDDFYILYICGYGANNNNDDKNFGCIYKLMHKENNFLIFKKDHSIPREGDSGAPYFINYTIHAIHTGSSDYIIGSIINKKILFDLQVVTEDTNKYNCIVNYSFKNGIKCTGTFINNHTLITSSECINKKRIHKINNINISHIKQNKRFINNNVISIHFHQFTYKCNKYFSVTKNIYNRRKLNICGYGYNNKNTFGCINEETTLFNTNKQLVTVNRNNIELFNNFKGSPGFDNNMKIYSIYSYIQNRNILSDCI